MPADGTFAAHFPAGLGVPRPLAACLNDSRSLLPQEYAFSGNPPLSAFRCGFRGQDVSIWNSRAGRSVGVVAVLVVDGALARDRGLAELHGLRRRNAGHREGKSARVVAMAEVGVALVAEAV